MLTRSLAAHGAQYSAYWELNLWPRYHPCPHHSDYGWDSFLVIRHSTGMSYVAGNINLAAVLNEQSTPQAAPGCNVMVITDIKNLIPGGNAQIWSSAITVKNMISNQVPNLSSLFGDKKHEKIQIYSTVKASVSTSIQKSVIAKLYKLSFSFNLIKQKIVFIQRIRTK